jgi:hypothetical protein
MTNGRMNHAEVEAILAGGQVDINRYLVTTISEIRETCRNRPATCEAARARKWTGRRTLAAWAAGLILSSLSIVSMIVALTGG